MLNNNSAKDFKTIFPKKIINEFIFPFDSYQLFLERLSIEPISFFNEWSDLNLNNIAEKYFNSNTKLDWKWSLSFPIFSLLKKLFDKYNNPIIIGFSGLPGSGKSTLGSWIDNIAKDLNLDIKVISLDDFYLPGMEMDEAIHGNPWNVPRGLPGSHSLDLLNQSLDTFLNTGFLKCPIFDKSLRDGKGDRSGSYKSRPKVLLLEGWFVGCDPISDLSKLNKKNYHKFNESLTQEEKEYRFIIQESLIDYSKIWKKLDKIIHLKSNNFNNIILWKNQQENEMLKLKGSSLQGKMLDDFIRMIQASIPIHTLESLNSYTTIEIDKYRRIRNLYSNQYIF